jgi:hypothetical protein|eukprot:7377394-Prymnesium_polylepis.1
MEEQRSKADSDKFKAQVEESILGAPPTRAEYEALEDKLDETRAKCFHLHHLFKSVLEEWETAVDVARAHGWAPPRDPMDEPHLLNCYPLAWIHDIKDADQLPEQMGSWDWKSPDLTCFQE